MTLSADTVDSLSAQNTAYYKQVAALVSAIGANLAIVEGRQDYQYSLRFRGNLAKFQTLDIVVDWFQVFGQPERLLANQQWTLQTAYDCTECYPFIHAGEIEAGQTVRLPFSKGHSWRVLNLGRETQDNVTFRYVPTVGNEDPITVCFNKLWRFQLLAFPDGSSAYQDDKPF